MSDHNAIILFRRGRNGINFYMATINEDSNETAASIDIYYGVIGGAVQRSLTNVTPVNINKSNYKDALIVAQERLAALEKECADKGYENLFLLSPMMISLAEKNMIKSVVLLNLEMGQTEFAYQFPAFGVLAAFVGKNLKVDRTDADNFPKAMMLCKSKLHPHHTESSQPKNAKPFPKWGTFDVQPKLDGVFALAGAFGLRTRGGKDRHTPKGDTLNNIINPLLIQELSTLYREYPELPMLNGELYTENTTLQQVTKAVKAKTELSDLLTLNVFDVVKENVLWSDRYYTLIAIRNIVEKHGFKYIKVVPTMFAASIVEFNMYYDKFVVRENGEGLVLRLHKGLYKPGLRSAEVLKYISYDDAECTILSIMPTPNATDEAMLSVVYKENIVFDLYLSEFTKDERRDILNNADAYINAKVTIRHRGFTDSGIPRQAVAKEISDVI